MPPYIFYYQQPIPTSAIVLSPVTLQCLQYLVPGIYIAFNSIPSSRQNKCTSMALGIFVCIMKHYWPFYVATEFLFPLQSALAERSFNGNHHHHSMDGGHLCARREWFLAGAVEVLLLLMQCANYLEQSPYIYIHRKNENKTNKKCLS